MTRGGLRGRRVPGGAFGGVSTGMSLASRRAWATKAVASKDNSSPVKARSKPDVSPPIVRYARAGDCNVLSFLAFLGQMSSPAQCPRAPRAFAFDLSLAFALALALAVESLPRDHSYRVQLQSFCQRVVRLWVFARITQQSGEIRLMDFVVFRLILLTIVVVRYAFLP